MTRYIVLLQVLDRLRAEAPIEYRSYHPDVSDVEGINVARSKAFVHLFLKVRFGILDFSTREAFLTEGTNDGGIDAYYIDTDTRVIYFIQSKFRTTEKNFEEKSIEIEELLHMDTNRILEGEIIDERGNEYNHKIKHMVQKIKNLDNISRYHYQVIILANVRDFTRLKLNTLTGGISADVFNYSRCYKELLFPLVTATYFRFDDLHISLNLSNKSAGAKISYSVTTEFAKVEITVVFVPTLEIAAAMDKYRNAILQFNPRSYLELEGQSVNREIRSSIEKRLTNEFALFNNGITVLSDRTDLNERIGQKDRAQLTLKNPQIINGGQTAYTLSQVYREYKEPARSQVFGEKEVLLKIITFGTDDQLPSPEKLDLIDAISVATNSQSAVSRADRRSNEPELKQLQDRCFEAFGLWLERKRGEFADGVREGYLDPDLIVDRNLFMRATALSRGSVQAAAAKRVFVESDFAQILNAPPNEFSRYHLALRVIRSIVGKRGWRQPRIQLDLMCKAYSVMVLLSKANTEGKVSDEAIEKQQKFVDRHWRNFTYHLAIKYPRYLILRRNKKKRIFHWEVYMKKINVAPDIAEYFNDPTAYDAVIAEWLKSDLSKESDLSQDEV